MWVYWGQKKVFSACGTYCNWLPLCYLLYWGETILPVCPDQRKALITISDQSLCSNEETAVIVAECYSSLHCTIKIKQCFWDWLIMITVPYQHLKPWNSLLQPCTVNTSGSFVSTDIWRQVSSHWALKVFVSVNDFILKKLVQFDSSVLSLMLLSRLREEFVVLTGKLKKLFPANEYLSIHIKVLRQRLTEAYSNTAKAKISWCCQDNMWWVHLSHFALH